MFVTNAAIAGLVCLLVMSYFFIDGLAGYLTGEAAGRQIWVVDKKGTSTASGNSGTAPTSPRKGNVVSKLLRAVSGGGGGGNNPTIDAATTSKIQEIAQAGRAEFGFNPAVNPNSTPSWAGYNQATQLRCGGRAAGAKPPSPSKRCTVSTRQAH